MVRKAFEAEGRELSNGSHALDTPGDWRRAAPTAKHLRCNASKTRTAASNLEAEGFPEVSIQPLSGGAVGNDESRISSHAGFHQNSVWLAHFSVEVEFRDGAISNACELFAALVAGLVANGP